MIPSRDQKPKKKASAEQKKYKANPKKKTSGKQKGGKQAKPKKKVTVKHKKGKWKPKSKKSSKKNTMRRKTKLGKMMSSSIGVV